MHSVFRPFSPKNLYDLVYTFQQQHNPDGSKVILYYTSNLSFFYQGIVRLAPIDLEIEIAEEYSISERKELIFYVKKVD